nr:retrovirus-related Pol polyprotein from transposon TNT 1-94 [Tanacetum cinerariifolium]
ILLTESQRNTTDPLVSIIDSLATDYDSVDDSSVYNTLLLLLQKLDAPARGNKSSSALKVNSASAGKLKSVKIEDDHPLAIRVMKSHETCGSIVHTTTNHNDIEWLRRGEALQAKKDEAIKLTNVESTKTNRSKTPTKRHDLRWCLKMNLHAQLKVIALSNIMFDEKRGIIFNTNKEAVMIAPRVRDVYVLDITSSTQESCFFSKASENLNWLWHKRLAHLNFKSINSLAK